VDGAAGHVMSDRCETEAGAGKHAVTHSRGTPAGETSRAPRTDLLTIGHSTLSIANFLERLAVHGVKQLADVRTIPRSRRYPHFEEGALAASLGAAGIAYRHFPSLGGLRRPRPDSTNTAWQHPGFRGYADYMATAAFEAGLDSLLDFARAAPTAVMCAEARWWQCHRRLLADAVLARGLAVAHIMGTGAAVPHEFTPFSSVRNGRVAYPGLL
jgi:uncharacterized protein (DUF488 family)